MTEWTLKPHGVVGGAHGVVRNGELRSCQFAITGQNPARALASSIGNVAARLQLAPTAISIPSVCLICRVASMAMASIDMSRVAVQHAQRTPFKSMQVALWPSL